MSDTRLEGALAEHFYRAACRWAELDGEPVEALVPDRFLVAAQDAVAELDLVMHSQPAEPVKADAVGSYQPSTEDAE